MTNIQNEKESMINEDVKIRTPEDKRNYMLLPFMNYDTARSFLENLTYMSAL